MSDAPAMMRVEEIAARLGLAFQAEIQDADIDAAWLSRLPLSFAKTNLLLPLREVDGCLLVAMGNPVNLLALDELQTVVSIPVKGIAAPPEVVLAAINRLYARHSGSAQEVVAELEAEDLSSIATQFTQQQDLLDLTDEAPVIRLLNSVLFQAVKERASDIHIEPFERDLDIRFRVDGILYKMLSPPKIIQEALASRVKIMAGLN
ncbi:MAG TPA: ATPase, T2SS/T4P/T4SS family, partial [Geobacteraceae bacterium]|nr:ATPase, T2SS/T4P/T4SS family [Geobacteraceae bacterium]